MKIAIIGGGWVGCHLAMKLKSEHKIVLFDKNEILFNESSSKNQNRLHLGYHYVRNFNTRNLCMKTFDRFENEYGFTTKEVKKNLYCVPQKKSLLDFQTYLKVFDDYNYKIIPNSLINIEGCLETEEKQIKFKICKDYFNENLSDVFVRREIKKKDIESFKIEYDLVLNCTNNFLRIESDPNHFYEVTISFLYRKIREIEFGALTLVDGDLFSIYPYDDDLFTITDVSITPLRRFTNPEKMVRFISKIQKSNFDDLVLKLEKKIMEFYPQLKEDFIYDSFFISTKSKTNDESNDRSPVINTQENLINIFTGKIQGIYLIEDYIINLIRDHENFSR